jgi:hypothetical protein
LPAKESPWRRRLWAATTSDAIEVGWRLITLQRSGICKGCWQQMHLPVPLRGMLSVPFRAFGLGVDVHDGDEGSKGLCRCHCPVRRFEGLHRSVAVPVRRTLFQGCSTRSTMNARTPFGRMTGCSTRPLATPSWLSSISPSWGRSCQSCGTRRARDPETLGVRARKPRQDAWRRWQRTRGRHWYSFW